LWLTTARSHDQYNTTIYKQGLKPDDRIDLVTASSDRLTRVVRNFRVVEYEFADGCCVA
jgi:hypothetical protein